MASLYTQQGKNIRKTWFLMTGFLVIIVGLGWLMSQLYGNAGILYGAIGFSLFMNVTAYWFSDKIALASTGAKPADENQYRELHRILENLAITAGIQKPRLYIVDDPAPNAFATGRNAKHAVVAVTTGLLTRLERSELEGVIAKEGISCRRFRRAPHTLPGRSRFRAPENIVVFRSDASRKPRDSASLHFKP